MLLNNHKFINGLDFYGRGLNIARGLAGTSNSLTFSFRFLNRSDGTIFHGNGIKIVSSGRVLRLTLDITTSDLSGTNFPIVAETLFIEDTIRVGRDGWNYLIVAIFSTGYQVKMALDLNNSYSIRQLSGISWNRNNNNSVLGDDGWNGEVSSFTVRNRYLSRDCL